MTSSLLVCVVSALILSSPPVNGLGVEVRLCGDNEGNILSLLVFRLKMLQENSWKLPCRQRNSWRLCSVSINLFGSENMYQREERK